MANIAPPPPAKGVRARGLEPGAAAPSFQLLSTPDCRPVTLESQRGSPLVLVFYPADFTPVCSDELAIFNELREELSGLGVKVYGISVDSVWSHFAFARELGLQIPLLSDFHPKAEVSRRYRVYREEDGFSERAQFVIDGDGKIAWSSVSPIEVNPGADGALAAVERLTGRTIGEGAARAPAQEARP
jgi:peroxiredoxin (alkyl hydroperoxide reductase subunit C)